MDAATFSFFISCGTMIHLENVTKIYNQGKESEVKALSEITLEIEEGLFLAVSGPSGSGKTTLLNIIGSLDRPTEGKVTVDGTDLSSLQDRALSEFRRHTVGFIFQLYNLIPSLTALENVTLPLKPYTENVEGRARMVLEELGLEGRSNHLPAELSGGERQRVAIARALITKPKILLADEPTGNIDTETGNKIVDLLKNLNEERGMTVVLASHDRRVVQKAERIVELRDGAIR